MCSGEAYVMFYVTSNPFLLNKLYLKHLWYQTFKPYLISKELLYGICYIQTSPHFASFNSFFPLYSTYFCRCRWAVTCCYSSARVRPAPSLYSPDSAAASFPPWRWKTPPSRIYCRLSSRSRTRRCCSGYGSVASCYWPSSGATRRSCYCRCYQSPCRRRLHFRPTISTCLAPMMCCHRRRRRPPATPSWTRTRWTCGAASPTVWSGRWSLRCARSPTSRTFPTRHCAAHRQTHRGSTQLQHTLRY